MMDERRQRLETYASAVKFDLVDLTQARVELGTATLREVLGYRFPWLFKRWAAENARRDREHREFQARMSAQIDAMRQELGIGGVPEGGST